MVGTGSTLPSGVTVSPMPVAASMLVRRSAGMRLPALIAVLYRGGQVPALIAGF
jgi:hypothetical protein